MLPFVEMDRKTNINFNFLCKPSIETVTSRTVYKKYIIYLCAHQTVYFLRDFLLLYTKTDNILQELKAQRRQKSNTSLRCCKNKLTLRSATEQCWTLVYMNKEVGEQGFNFSFSLDFHWPVALSCYISMSCRMLMKK